MGELAKDALVAECAEFAEDEEDSQHQAKVADDVNHKGFSRCGYRRGTLVPETD